MMQNPQSAWKLLTSFLGSSFPKNPSTDWSQLSTPYVCGLLATNPSQFSAKLHNTGFRSLDIPFHYHAFKVKDLSTPINAMRDMGFRGYSVTIPFKEEAIRFIDDIRPSVKATGAVNTIINSGKQLHGYNTDWLGVVGALLEIKESYKGQSALIIGAGGAGRAAIYALQNMGFGKIVVANRTMKRAKEVSDDFGVDILNLNQINKSILTSSSVVINATSQTYLENFPYEALTSKHTVFDMITKETDLTLIGQKNGAQVIHGLRMLLYQGLVQFKLFSEKDPPLEQMDNSIR
jgi:shikimate dehydrogenase